MKTSIRSIAFAAVLLLVPASAMAQSSDREAVDQVMQKFLSAYPSADGALVSDVFRKDGVMIGYSPARGSALLQRTGEQLAEGFNGTPAANEAKRKRTYEIVDMAENLAAVRINLDYPGWRGVDYIVLLKTDGKWQMISKTWTGVLTSNTP